MPEDMGKEMLMLGGTLIGFIAAADSDGKIDGHPAPVDHEEGTQAFRIT